jgi:hypothetical protein
MYTYCPGCRRKCLGFVTLCLDCEFALDQLGQDGYRDGFHHAIEWGVAHPHQLKQMKQNSTVPTECPYQATSHLASAEELETYNRGFRNGFRRGVRCAKTRESLYRAVLDEFLIDLGRRRAMLYCAYAMCRLPPRALAWFDPNLLRMIDQYF